MVNTDNKDSDALAREIVELHRFLEDWFTASCENNEAVLNERLHARMDKDFYIVLPGGKGMAGSDFWPEFQTLYGSNTDFQISIRNVQRRPCSNDDLIIASYEEWQKGAKYSEPPNNARLSSAVLIRDAAAPNGFRWAHIHETWLPQAQVSADSFDW